MSRLFLGAAMLIMSANNVQAQPPDRGFPGGIGGPPGFHLMTALDSDRDGKISSREMDGAVAALRKLDKDEDGKLSGEEIGWPPSFGGRFPGFGGRRGGGLGGGNGFPGGGFPRFGGEPAGRPQRPDPDAQAERKTTRGDSTDRPQFFSVAQLKRLDRNGDGRITREEVPRRMRELIVGRLDANNDGVIDRDELSAAGKPEK